MTSYNEHILDKIFMPTRCVGLQKLTNEGGQLVHYTSSENALNIIKSQELWLRSPTCMNDYSEVQHGYKMLWNYFENKENKKIFNDAMEQISAGSMSRILSKFDKWWETVSFHTFIASVSVHFEHEKQFGRLSMWRAYGSESGKAALILNNPPPNDESGILFYPAIYEDQKWLDDTLNKMAKDIAEYQDLLIELGVNMFEDYVLTSLMTFVLTLKHRGFIEEQEWRLIYLRNLNQRDFIKKEIISLGGLPQVVYKFPLNTKEGVGVEGLELRNLLDEVLIGPTNYPHASYAAFTEALADKGFNTKVSISTVPLRT